MNFTSILMIGLVFLVVVTINRLIKAKQLQKKANEKYLQDLEKYKSITSEQFDAIEDKDLTNAILFHIIGKEDGLYEQDGESDLSLYDVLSDGERMIYAIYLVEIAMRGGRGSLHSFFIEEQYEKYRPYVQQAFRDIDCPNIADLIKAAARLAQIIEQDLHDEENDIDQKYANYNFADYTRTIIEMLKTSDVLTKAATYIKNHKAMFIDEDKGESRNA